MGILDALFKPNVERLAAGKDVEGLIKALNYKKGDWQQSVEVRRQAARALGQIQDPRAIEPLIDTMWDVAVEVGEEGARALGLIQDPRVVERLLQRWIAAWKDQEWRTADLVIQSFTEKVLIEIKGTDAVAALVSLLTNGADAVRRGAAAILGRIGDPKTVEVLFQAFQNDGRPEVRSAVLQALGQIKDEHAVQRLAQVLLDKDNPFREKAAEVLGEVGEGAAVEALVQALGDEDVTLQEAAEGALVQVKRGGIAPLTQALREQDSQVRRRIVTLLGTMWEKRAVALIFEASKDLANSTLVAMQEAGTIDLLGQALQDSSVSVRLAAAETFFKFPHQGGVESLIAALQDEVLAVRATAARALGKTKDERAVAPLEAAAQDVGRGIQEEAHQALQALSKSLEAVRRAPARVETTPAPAREEPEEATEKEAQQLIQELITIGLTVGYLSTQHGGDFDEQYRNSRAREIGARLHELGGMALMRRAGALVQETLAFSKPAAPRELEVAWGGIGEWLA